MVLEACPFFFAYKGLWCLRCSDVMGRIVTFYLKLGRRAGQGSTDIGEHPDLLFFDNGEKRGGGREASFNLLVEWQRLYLLNIFSSVLETPSGCCGTICCTRGQRRIVLGLEAPLTNEHGRHGPNDEPHVRPCRFRNTAVVD